MIKVENIDVYGFETAIRGMRNPLNSWERSDSYCTHIEDAETNETANFEFFIGENDLNLMKRLFNGGSEHRKYMRMMNITMDITAPLYWWKEFDTYKVGTSCNSCSTMHKIHAKEFTLDDFSHEHLIDEDFIGGTEYLGRLRSVIEDLNEARQEYLETKDKKYWWQMIQLLPTSYNQRRTVQMNYEVAVNIIKQREYHKLDEWRELVEILKELPYMKELLNE